MRQIGRGGMGAVFEAQHERLPRRAAIKVLWPDVAEVPGMVSRFFNEAQAVNIIAHPGIVSIFEYGQLPDESVYIVMEFLDGETLASRIAAAPQGRLDLAALRLVRQLASALGAAHARGIIHRDLKPENIMIIPDPDVPGGERTKILDFGIAKLTATPRDGEGDVPTAAGSILGTLRYMSPEQCKNAAEVTDRADVYALGAVLYEILSGKPPFSGSPPQLIGMHLFKKPRPLRDAAPDTPPPLADLVMSMLAKDSAARPSMAQVAEKIDRLLAAPRSRPAPRWPLFVAGGALTLGLASVALRKGQDPARPLPQPPRIAAPPPRVEQPPQPDPLLLAVAVLRDSLRDRDPLLRARALTALGRSGAQHRILVEPLLSDPEPRVRSAAARALGTIGAQAATPSLHAVWDGKQAPTDPDVGLAVAEALSQLGDPLAERLLRRLLYSKNPAVQRVAAVALSERGDPKLRRVALGLVKALPAADQEERAQLLGRLARAGDRRAQDELRQLAPADAVLNSEAQLRAAAELVRSGDERLRPSLEASAQAEGLSRLLAARLLAGLEDPAGFALFRKTVANPQSALSARLLSAEGLGDCGLRDGLVTLAAVLPRDSAPPRVRLAAAGAVLQIAAGEPALLEQEALAWVEAALLDESAAVRSQAVVPLGAAPPRLALPLLGRAIRDPQAEVRQSAAQALGRTRVRGAVPILGEALGDKVGGVRREAIQSLGLVGRQLRQRGEPVDDLISAVSPRAQSGEPDERVASLSTLLSLGDARARSDLTTWLKDRDPALRLQAVEALGVDPGASREPLVEALADPAPQVRLSAALRLAQLGGHEGAKVLRDASAAGGPQGLLASGVLRRLGEQVPNVSAGSPAQGDLATRLLALGEAATLPATDSVPLLRQALRDPAPQVRRRLTAVLADLALRGEDAALPLLRTLASDGDAEVRAHAGAALGQRGRPATGRPMDEAMTAYLRGEPRRAIALAGALPPAVAQRIVGASACASKDAELARKAYGEAEDPAARRLLERVCQRNGITLLAAEAARPPVAAPAIPASAAPARPPDLRPAAAPTPRAPRPENPLSNEAIRLPPRAMSGKVEVKDDE